MRKAQLIILGGLCLTLALVPVVKSAYHHEGERDAAKFLNVYPNKKGTKLDHCSLCHTGGSYVNNKGQTVSLGSCQWCHDTYGYDGSGNIADTMNPYGIAFKANGRNEVAIQAIATLDSDGDTYSNGDEIAADRFPGDATDDPTKKAPPFRIYTRQQLEALAQHTQFLLMNTSRSGDFYAEYTGVPLEDLLADAGVLPGATNIKVYAPDGWSQYHPMDEDTTQPEWYHVRGTYPAASYYYDEQADEALNPVDGWCDYSAPSCRGRDDADAIVNPNGLKLLLAYKREGAYMDPGILSQDNKLDGEGPFRVVPPQKSPNAPDQSSRAANQSVVWPHRDAWDHNAGAASRSATIIKVEPIDAQYTDINVYEAGWAYVDQDKIIVYGGIDDTDSNGNGVLDSEEKDSQNPNSDFDNDGIPDFQDKDTARVRHAYGKQKMLLHANGKTLKNVGCMCWDDPEVQTGKPATMAIPYGVLKFEIEGLVLGEQVTVSLVFPGNVPTNAKYYKTSAAGGWQEIPFGSNDGDNTITITVTDGDPLTDADGLMNQRIVDPGALAVPQASSTSSADGGGGGGGGGCFISTLK